MTRSGITGFLVQLVFTAIALAVAAWLIPGIRVADGQSLVLTAVIFGLVNAIVKPALTFLSCPLIVLTLGLFLLVINAAMLGITAWISGQIDGGFAVDGFGSALLGALVVSVVSWTLTQVTD